MANFARRLIALISLAALLAGCGSDNPAKSAGCGDPVEGEVCVEPVTDQDWVLGKRDAGMSLVVYMDMECQYCKEYYPTLQELQRNNPSKLNIVFRHFPLKVSYPNSAKLAEACECAGFLGGNDKFWAFTDRVFEITSGGLDLAQLPEIGKAIGLDGQEFTACLNSGRFTDKIDRSIVQAEIAGAPGTPYTVIVVGIWEVPIMGNMSLDYLEGKIAELEAVIQLSRSTQRGLGG